MKRSAEEQAQPAKRQQCTESAVRLEELTDDEYAQVVNDFVAHHNGQLQAQLCAQLADARGIAGDLGIDACQVVLHGCTPLHEFECRPNPYALEGYLRLIHVLLHPDFGVEGVRAERGAGPLVLPPAWQRVDENTQELTNLNAVLDFLHSLKEGQTTPRLPDGVDAGVTLGALREFHARMHDERHCLWQLLELPRHRSQLRRTTIECEPGDVIVWGSLRDVGANSATPWVSCYVDLRARNEFTAEHRRTLLRLQRAGVVGFHAVHAARAAAYARETGAALPEPADEVAAYLLGSKQHRAAAHALVDAIAERSPTDIDEKFYTQHRSVFKPAELCGDVAELERWHASVRGCLAEFVAYANWLLPDGAPRVSLDDPATWAAVGDAARNFYGGQHHLDVQTSSLMYLLSEQRVASASLMAVPRGFNCGAGGAPVGLYIDGALRLELEEELARCILSSSPPLPLA